jgi:hypothetical protein
MRSIKRCSIIKGPIGSIAIITSHRCTPIYDNPSSKVEDEEESGAVAS